ncbi:MAG: hypothetical protein MUC56_12045 [Thermoanaerobaculales bacterium]|jgi:hypothetical protein|nr:hypothetical protein [Thermoanaerobaculales bacterium]
MSGHVDKIAVLGREFTIQTEYIAGEPAKIRTLVYDGGRLVSSREIAMNPGADSPAAIDAAVMEQHGRITDTLVRRASELRTAKTPAGSRPSPPPPPASPPPAASRRALRPIVKAGSPLATAIAVRQTIGPFALAFARPAPTTAGEYERLLESVDGAIDAIRAAPTYRAIRLDEQLTLIALKSQLETWQLADRDLAMAVEIWPGVEAFAHHLLKINHRGDLVTFDHQLLTWTMSELGRGEVTGEMIEALAGLGGRDAALDAFLRAPSDFAPYDLLEILLRLLDQTLA